MFIYELELRVIFGFLRISFNVKYHIKHDDVPETWWADALEQMRERKSDYNNKLHIYLCYVVCLVIFLELIY
jgi:hypothetical protein